MWPDLASPKGDRCVVPAYVLDAMSESPVPSTECEQCGRDATDLEPVHRVYVIPEAWDQEGKVTKLAEVEVWCFSCRTQYPCDPAEDTASA